MDWIRAKDIPSEYPISKTKACDLTRQFRAETDDWIKDGRVLIIKKESFEEWWKQRSRQRPA